MATMRKLTPFSVVVGLDFRDAGGYAFAQAARIARAIPGSDVHLVHVFEHEFDPALRVQLVERLRPLFANDEAASLGGSAGLSIGIHLRVGDPVHEIAQLASDVGATMIVIGAHKGPHVRHWFLGSVTHRLLHSSLCPVLVAGPRPTAAKHEPAIEPPCTDCVRARAESSGATWWCLRHANGATHDYAFSYQRETPLSSHDSEVIPTGIDF
jgi:nucleotide-binding universal stress UspA family protein